MAKLIEVQAQKFMRRRKLRALKKKLLAKHKPDKNLKLFRLA